MRSIRSSIESPSKKLPRIDRWYRTCVRRFYPLRRGAALLSAAVFLTGVSFSATAMAQDYPALHITHAALETYKATGDRIPACSAAFATDTGMKPEKPEHAALVAQLYGKCHNALLHQHASARVLHVNDTMLGLQCIVVGASGYDVHAIPACDFTPY